MLCTNALTHGKQSSGDYDASLECPGHSGEAERYLEHTASDSTAGMSHGAPESSVSSAVRAKPYASTQLQGHRSATISGNTANLGHAETTGANGWMIVYADGSCIREPMCDLSC